MNAFVHLDREFENGGWIIYTGTIEENHSPAIDNIPSLESMQNSEEEKNEIPRNLPFLCHKIAAVWKKNLHEKKLNVETKQRYEEKAEAEREFGRIVQDENRLPILFGPIISIYSLKSNQINGKDRYSKFELTPERKFIFRGTFSDSLEEIISNAKAYAQNKGLVFIQP